MKLVSFLDGENDRIGIYYDEKVYPLNVLDQNLPDNMLEFLADEEPAMNRAKELYHSITHKNIEAKGIPLDEVELLAPVPFPTSVRDAYAFRQHVETARRNRGAEMIPEFDEYPVFYFTNHNAIYGPGDIPVMPDHLEKLDFELEVAIVIGKHGRNIKAEEADKYIAGFMIMNDFSARVLQMDEMKLNLGPAKGKDFASALGPFLVTPDELERYIVPAMPGHTGINYNLQMKAYVNGIQVSEGNMKDMTWTFAEIIERASYGVDLLPGDVIGSGTVGTGCFLEINGTKLLNEPDYPPQWLEDEDEVELSITGLGNLINTILVEDSEFSILGKKKKQNQLNR
jgi:fumarylacetoacetate (FAA) hydrolase